MGVSRARMAAEISRYSGPRPLRTFTMSSSVEIGETAVASSSVIDRISRKYSAMDFEYLETSLLFVRKHGV